MANGNRPSSGAAQQLLDEATMKHVVFSRVVVSQIAHWMQELLADPVNVFRYR